MIMIGSIPDTGVALNACNVLCNGRARVSTTIANIKGSTRASG